MSKDGPMPSAQEDAELRLEILDRNSDITMCLAEVKRLEKIALRIGHAWCFTSLQGGFPRPFVDYMTKKYGGSENWPNPWAQDALDWAAEFEGVAVQEEAVPTEVPEDWECYSWDRDHRMRCGSMRCPLKGKCATEVA